MTMKHGDPHHPGDASDEEDDAPTAVDAEKLERARRQSESNLDAGGSTVSVEQARATLGSLRRVPRLARPLPELRERIRGTRHAYLLAFVDGILTLEAIVTLVGLPEAEALGILHHAVVDGLVVLSPEAS